jgi:hypothetical protein
VQDAPDEHDASPVHSILPASVFTATWPMQDDEPEQAMSQLAALQVTVPVHDDAPHVTEQVAPAQITLPHALAALQSTAQSLAALQSTSISDDDGVETEHGMPAGQLAQPPKIEQWMTQVPPLQVPTPPQRAAQRAAAVGPPPSDASGPVSAAALSDASGWTSAFASCTTPSSGCASAMTPSSPVTESPAIAASDAVASTPSTAAASPALGARPLARRPHPATQADETTRRNVVLRGRPRAYAGRID